MSRRMQTPAERRARRHSGGFNAIPAMLAVFFLIVGFAFPPLLLVSAVFAWVFFSPAFRYRAAMDQQHNAQRERERKQALRYFK